ncbi:uncharacterized protein LOC133287441 [Gastrolobium bilobum]|uniref:uncharacterized protein LOC133287441 n=1 Tax=Gastrolobium bilobum TaxID=150636 RepID=UPI002AB1B56F|nr:uncharacterized protein LOC133287441 [Gastrolobium bilobum]
MGAVVLHPKDCLRNEPYSQPIIYIPRNMKFPNSCPKSRSERHKRSHHQNPASTSDPKPQVNQLVMGQVKILKRGQQLNETAPDPQSETLDNAITRDSQLDTLENELAPDSQLETSENELTPDCSKLETAENELASDSQSDNDLSSTLSLPGGLYAGPSMFVVSPPPSSVPLPAFVAKKIVASSDATRDLRKMLHLDFP